MNATQSGRPVRVLHIFGRMERGGAELRMIDVLRMVDPGQVALEFCTLSGLPGSLDEEIRALGSEVHPCPLGPRFPGAFKRLLRERQIDVVHSHVHHFSGYLLRLARQDSVDVRIAHMRSMSDGRGTSLRRRAQRAVTRRWIDRHATCILAVSRGVMVAAWSPVFQEDPRCKVVYSGLDLQPFLPSPDRRGVRDELALPADSEIVVHVGNMSAAKNHARLIDIFCALAARRSLAHLVLVGRPSPAIEAVIREKTDALDLRNRVHVLGERGDVPRLLAASDLMIFPSVREGLPGAVLEATAAGIPVVASDLPGVLEIAYYFSSVVCRSLTENDSLWVNAAEAALDSAAASHDDQNAVDRFAMTPFSLKESVAQLTTIWRQG